MSVCLFVCPSVQPITFEPLHIETSFLVWKYIFTISRLSLSIKVIGSRSRSYEKNDNATYFNILILCICLQVINKVKVNHQGEGHIKIKVKISNSFNYFVGISDFVELLIHLLCTWVDICCGFWSQDGYFARTLVLIAVDNHLQDGE